jgi:prevent-host-death family protein
MTNIGAYEAKTHLSEILKKVSRGEKFLITKHGTAIAQILPAEASLKIDVASAIQQIKDFRKGNRLGDLGIKDLINAGRRG